MRHFILYIGALCLLASACHRHRKAEMLYERAEAALFDRDYHIARRYIDSIPLCDSTATEWIGRGIVLNHRVTLEENRRNLAYIDSLLPLLHKTRDSIMSQFYYRHDSLYQDDGRYIHKSEKYPEVKQCSHLRLEITPDYKAEIISVYCGNKPLRHVAAKIQLPNGVYALTPTTPYDNGRNYRYAIGDNRYYELVSYSGLELRSIFETIVLAEGRPVKISYEGDFPYSYTLSESDRKAFTDGHRLLSLQKHIRQLEREQNIARETIDLLARELAKQSAQE